MQTATNEYGNWPSAVGLCSGERGAYDGLYSRGNLLFQSYRQCGYGQRGEWRCAHRIDYRPTGTRLPPLPAALVGVYLHGKAGDKATQYYGQEGVNAGDLADFIGETWAEWETGNTENPL